MDIMVLTKNQIDILEHTASRAANGHFCGDSEDMQELVKLGFMVSVGKVAFCPDEFFRLTKKGREAVK